jgi:sugar phosphate isomerase/epimerase
VGEKRYTAMQLLNKADTFQLKLLQFGDNLPLHELTDKELDALKAASQEKGITLETGTRGFTEENIRRYAKISNKLHAKFLRIIIDDAGYEPDVETVVSVFRKVEPELAESGVRLGIENHDRFSSASLQKIIKDANSKWLGICLDTVNSFGAGEGLPTILENLLPHTINVHMKDFIIRRLPHKQGFIIEGCPAGQGMTPVQRILKQVSFCETDTHIIFEQWVPPEADMEDTIAKEAAWAEQGIVFLKKVLYGI